MYQFMVGWKGRTSQKFQLFWSRFRNLGYTPKDESWLRVSRLKHALIPMQNRLHRAGKAVSLEKASAIRRSEPRRGADASRRQ